MTTMDTVLQRLSPSVKKVIAQAPSKEYSPFVTASQSVLDLLIRGDEDVHAYHVLNRRVEVTDSVTYGDLRRRIRRLSDELKQCEIAQCFVLIPAKNELNFIVGFYAVIEAGGTPVPFQAPKTLKEVARTKAIIDSLGSFFLLLDDDYGADFMQPFIGIKAFDDRNCLHRTRTKPALQLNNPLFLQFTSGSTGRAKGVPIFLDNFLNNSASIAKAFKVDRQDALMSWLPPYHDMGLVGKVLHAPYVGTTCYLLLPELFVQKPARWLQAISRYNVRVSGAPNFAYQMCYNRVSDDDCKELDLSSWKVAFNGSERVDAQTLDNFSSRFSKHGFSPRAHFPVYGMAEATLFLTGPQVGAELEYCQVDSLPDEGEEITLSDSNQSKRLVSCGNAFDDTVVVVHDEQILGERQLGQIAISGKSCIEHYLNSDQADKFKQIDGTRYFMTGDQGFLWHDNLYVIGRIDDQFTLRGVNYLASEIENYLEVNFDDINDQGVVLYPDVPGEGLTLLIEIRRERIRSLETAELTQAIKQAVGQHWGLTPDCIKYVLPHSLAKTSSNKKMRGHTALRHNFESLRPIKHPPHSANP